jgi:probable HAF family extracellular repeat protein
MKSRRFARIALASVMGALALDAAAQLAPYRLDWLGLNFFPMAMNDRGQVIGTDDRGSGLGPALLWEAGVVRELGIGQGNDINNDGVVVLGVPAAQGYLGAAVLNAAGVRTDLALRGWGGDFRHQYSINSAGHVVGMEKFEVNSDGRAFIWDGQAITYLHLGVATSLTSAHGVNDAGQVVGWWSGTQSGVGGGFLWEDGHTTFLPSPGVSINNKGEVLLGGSVWHDGDITAIPALALLPVSDPKMGPTLEGREINDAGQVVGTSQEMYFIDVESGYGSIQRGFLWDAAGDLVDLNAVMGFDLGEFRDLPLSRPMDINNAGQIVGYGPRGAWMLTPVPEPSAAVLLLAAVGFAALRRGPAGR